MSIIEYTEKKLESIVLPDTPQQQFRSGIERIVKRSEIYRQLGKGIPVTEIKEHVRTYADKIRPDLLADQLIEDVNSLSTEVYDTTRELKKILSQKYKGIIAIAVFGSLGNRGNIVLRQAIGGEKAPDFDWGIIYDPQVNNIDNRKASWINIDAQKYLVSKGLNSCLFMNPVSERAPLLRNDKDVDNLLDRFASDDIVLQSKSMIYFTTLVPAFVLDDNLEKIFKKLVTLSQTDYDKWSIVTNNIKYHWRNKHVLLGKHLRFKEFNIDEVDTSEDRDKKIRRDVTNLSVEVMSSGISEVLDCTYNQGKRRKH